MRNEKIRIGFVGCGWIVEHTHIPAFQSTDDVNVISVFDVDLLRAKRVSIYLA